MKKEIKGNGNFEKDLKQVVEILQARGVTTAVIGMGSEAGPQQVLFGEVDKMLVLCASIIRRISDLTDSDYEETADMVKCILTLVKNENKNKKESELS